MEFSPRFSRRSIPVDPPKGGLDGSLADECEGAGEFGEVFERVSPGSCPQVLDIYAAKYSDSGKTLVAERLQKDDNLCNVSVK